MGGFVDGAGDEKGRVVDIREVDRDILINYDLAHTGLERR